MPILDSDKLILSKIEGTYGTDSVPTAVLNAILTKNFSLTPVEGDRLTRDLDLPGLGSQKGDLTSKRRSCSFEIEAAGSGVKDTPVAYAHLLRIMGFAETINAVVSVQYDPISAAFPSASLYGFEDDQLFKLLGARAGGGLRFEAGQHPVFLCSPTGLYSTPTEAAQGVADHSAFTAPLEVNNTNTTFTLGGYAAILKKLDLDFGNEVGFRGLVGSETIELSDRKITGTALIEMPTITEKNYWTEMENATDQVLSLIHGTVDGNIVEIQANQVEIGLISTEEENNVKMLSLPLTLTVTSAGDDDIRILTR